MTSKHYQRLAIALLTVLFAGFYYGEIISPSADSGARTDFASYYIAGEMAASGENFYDFALLSSKNQSNRAVYPYIYPPTVANLFSFLNVHDMDYAKLRWSVFLCICLAFSTVFFVSNCTSLGSWGIGADAKTRWLVFLSFIVFIFAVCALLRLKDNLLLGQVNIFVLFFIVIAIVASRKGSYYLSGAMIAVAAMLKITPLLLIPFIVPARGTDIRRFAIGILVATILIFILSVLLFGACEWINFFSISTGWGYGESVEGLFVPSVTFNQSIAGFFSRVFGDGSVIARYSTWSVVVALFGFLLYWKRKRGLDAVLMPLLIAMVVASPMAYRHHFIFLLPGLFVLADRTMQARQFSILQKSLIMIVVGASLYLAGFPWDKFFTPTGVGGLFVNNAGLGFLALAFVLSLWYSRAEEC